MAWHNDPTKRGAVDVHCNPLAGRINLRCCHPVTKYSGYSGQDRQVDIWMHPDLQRSSML
eukprot:364950-Chlamydomonas_euryale.AAC.23